MKSDGLRTLDNFLLISFYSKTLRDAPLRYNIMDKHAFSLIKALKAFRVYILHSHTLAFVPSITVKDILTQLDPEGKRAKWIAILLEYDLDIKHTKLIRGQGLAKLITQPSIDLLELNLSDTNTDSNIQNDEKDISPDYLASPWYADIIYVLNNLQEPLELSKSKARSVKLKSAKYCILDWLFILEGSWTDFTQLFIENKGKGKHR